MTSGPTFIPGWQVTFLLNADDVSAIGAVVSISRTKNVMTKPTFGSDFSHSLAGQKMGSFSANGHLSAEQITDLEAAFDQSLPIDFSIQIGIAGTVTDGGLLTGKCTLGELTYEAAADGEWDWSVEAQTSGDVVHTPATP